jgi:uncharacterized repeat protein (TIGR01451 family)
VLYENGTLGGASTDTGIFSFGVEVTDANGFEATGTISVTIFPEITATADLRLTVESNLSEAAIGDEVVILVKLTNHGAGAADNVVVRDDQIANVQQQVGAIMVTRLNRVGVEVDQGEVNFRSGEWSIGRIDAKAAATMTVRLVVVEP